MWPTLLEIGSLRVHTYGVMIAVGFLLALYIVQRESVKAGLDTRILSDATFWALFVGLAGTRVLHIIMFRQSYTWNPIDWIAIWRGGLVFQGGPPVAIPFCYFYLRKKGLNPWKVADIAFPVLALAQAFGRLGCFLNGCCYGLPTALPWGVPFPRIPQDLSLEPTGSPVFQDHCERFSDLSLYGDRWSHPVHPTQLYEFLSLLAIFFLLQFLKKKWRPFDGFALPVYFIAHGSYRFFVEMVRGDHNPVHFMGLTDQQMFCVGFVVFGLLTFPILRVLGRPRAE